MRLIDADPFGVIFLQGKSEEFIEGVKFILDKIYEAPTVEERPQWIPCSERLPEEIGDYLVTEHLSDIAQAVYVSSFGHVRTGELCFYYEDDDGRAIKNDGIVAWMSLPEPYKGEQ